MSEKIEFLFDFDGVLIDSHPETMVTAFNSVKQELRKSVEELPPLFVKYFEGNRSRAKNAGEIYLLACWCLEQIEFTSGQEIKLLTREQFADEVAKRSKDEIDFGEIFFAQREIFMNHYRTPWLSLFKPYQPLWDVLLKKIKPIIVTYKNRSAVNELCQYYNLTLTDEYIYSGDQSTGKVENIISMHQRFNADQYVFIDDAVRNLTFLKENLPSNIKIELCYAKWGYGAQDDLELALNSGFTCYEQKEFAERLVKS